MADVMGHCVDFEYQTPRFKVYPMVDGRMWTDANEAPEGVRAVDYGAFGRNATPDDVREWRLSHPGEQALAYCHAFVENECRSAMHELGDPMDPSRPYPESLYRARCGFSKDLYDEIDAVLESEGVKADREGTYYRAAPFMARNGYTGEGGWWVPE